MVAVTFELFLVSSLIVLIRILMVSFLPCRHFQGVDRLSNFFCHLFVHLFLSVLVGDGGVGCKAGLASGELVQLPEVAESPRGNTSLLAPSCGLPRPSSSMQVTRC